MPAGVTTVAGTVTLVSIGSVGVAPSFSGSVVVVVPTPPLPELVSVGGGPLVPQGENSDVGLAVAVDVDVAVTTVPSATGVESGTEKLPAPLPFVVTLTVPSKVWPS